ncbi:hypothetical protein NDU88_004153 [Pleurodeles waltl]|uniref:Uncharacterized protein n=1 Tax=Pleurodeles waltl TaxID=8319 RepID=A0AAV7NRQ1_PLEWA|nr:hypothetical protein NDU88_004153 [Pleurodeles waltl]
MGEVTLGAESVLRSHHQCFSRQRPFSPFLVPDEVTRTRLEEEDRKREAALEGWMMPKLDRRLNRELECS